MPSLGKGVTNTSKSNEKQNFYQVNLQLKIELKRAMKSKLVYTII